MLKMDFDSIIFIIIAIVIAVVNGILQKNKKTATKSRVHINQAQQADTESEEHPMGVNIEEEVNPLEILFGKSEHRASDIDHTISTAKTDKLVDKELVVAEEKSTAASVKKQIKRESQKSDDFKHEANVFDFDEDSISSSAITNVLTEEEEEQAFLESASDFEKNFNAKDAILYSEIIKPKYF
jgi:type III secretory pathway component EscV